MEKNSDNRFQPEAKRLSNWIRLLAILYRIPIVLGLISLGLAIILLALSTRLSFWIILIPGFSIALGILMARLEYILHNRHLRLKGRIADDDDGIS